MADAANPPHDEHAEDGGTRRDFLYLTTAAVGGLGTLIALWPLVDSMNPSAEVLALSTTEVDLSPIEEGQAITVIWQGQPVFIRHRTPEEIEEARDVDVADLPDPESDEARAEKPEFLVMVGVCTHLGCIPKGRVRRLVLSLPRLALRYLRADPQGPGANQSGDTAVRLSRRDHDSHRVRGTGA